MEKFENYRIQKINMKSFYLTSCASTSASNAATNHSLALKEFPRMEVLWKTPGQFFDRLLKALGKRYSPTTTYNRHGSSSPTPPSTVHPYVPGDEDSSESRSKQRHQEEDRLGDSGGQPGGWHLQQWQDYSSWRCVWQHAPLRHMFHAHAKGWRCGLPTQKTTTTTGRTVVFGYRR